MVSLMGLTHQGFIQQGMSHWVVLPSSKGVTPLQWRGCLFHLLGVVTFVLRAVCCVSALFMAPGYFPLRVYSPGYVPYECVHQGMSLVSLMGFDPPGLCPPGYVPLGCFAQFQRCHPL